ncbi:MAG TPA: hypothetical protein VFN49_02465 [Candidatus Aquilonibacter sp.]|nr:hypothetical protein [Candidatus Aquilonibacter sp.]
MLKRVLFPAAVLTVIGLVACNGGGSTISGPTPGPTCGPNVTSQLIYPAAGSTVSSSNVSEIVIAVSSPLPINTYNLALLGQNNGNVQSQTGNALAQINASQLPAGSGSTTISNPTYEAVNLINPLSAVFSSGTTIQTAINLPNSTCTPQNVPGTFTLQ